MKGNGVAETSNASNWTKSATNIPTAMAKKTKARKSVHRQNGRDAILTSSLAPKVSSMLFESCAYSY